MPMSLKTRLLALLFLLLTAAGSGLSAPRQISEILRLDKASGLGSQKAYSILEDNNGAIWIGTKAGVDRYNGRKLTNYSLSDEHIYEDMAGRITRLYYSEDTLYAYDTSGKVYKYSDTYDNFELYLRLSEHVNKSVTLNKFVHTSDGLDLLASDDGLFLRKADEAIQPIIPNVSVNDILLTDMGLFVGTSSGMKILNNDQNINDVNSLQGLNIISLCYDATARRLYIGTFDRGLWMLDVTNLSAQQIHPESSLLTKPIRSIIEISPTDLAIGVDGNGVLNLDRSDGLLSPLVNTDLNPDFAFVGNGIYALSTDRNGNLWIGSYTGGVTMIGFSAYPIQILTKRTDDPCSLSNNNVNSIIENIDGAIWYATDRGISIADSNAKSWKHVLKDDVVVTMCRMHDGDILAGCYGEGLYQLDKSGAIKKHWTQKAGDLPFDYIFTIKVDFDGNIWLGSPHGPLTVFNPTNKATHQYEIDKVLSISIPDDKHICACTVNGFYIIDPSTDSYKWYANQREHEGQDYNSYIIPALFNNDSTVWLGSEGGGLILYDIPHRKIIRSAKVENGLPSNDIYCLQKDLGGRLWVGTGAGIAIVSDTIITSLNYINGTTQEYNKLSSTRLNSGNLVFGSTAGAILIDPEKISIDNYTADLRITGLTIVGATDEQNHNLLPELKQMIARRTISLSHDHNSFQLDFEAINIRFRDDISYRHFLEGYDKEWSEVSPDGMARFRNLPPGDYTLKIIALRNSNNKVLDADSITISVKKPWWNTAWAWMIYILVAGLLTYFLVRYKWYQLSKRHDEDKISFFINTAHDIRTPLSLVMAPLEELFNEKDLSEKAKYLLGVASSNIRKLNAVISQLMDFEKIDSKKVKAQLEPVNLNYLLSEEVSCFKNICDKKGVDLSLNIPDNNVVISADKHLIELMLDNLLSNACKYTPEGGSIEVNLQGNKNKAVISVADTGIGIPEKDHKNIFSNVYRAANARATQETGNGFGLLQVKSIIDLLGGNISFTSKEGRGTTFTIAFKRIYDEPAIQWNATGHTTSVDEINTPTAALVGGSSNKDETLLIVEDNDDLRNYLVATFRSDYNVVSTNTADDALLFLASHYPDIILSDVMMPGIQGNEFCKIVKSNPDTAGIPIILLTAKSNHDAIVDGLDKGADDYISKPFSLDILKSKIRGMLANRKRIRDYLLGNAVRQAEAIDDAAAAAECTSPICTAAPTADAAMSDADCDFVAKATNIVIENISNIDFDIESLCREMAMSRTLFYSRLKSLTGKAPQEFIRIMRLERAAELLRRGLAVNEVAEKTGFTNSKYFSTIFKKHFGISPSKYYENQQ